MKKETVLRFEAKDREVFENAFDTLQEMIDTLPYEESMAKVIIQEAFTSLLDVVNLKCVDYWNESV